MSDFIRREDAIDKAILVPIAKVVTEDKVIYRRVVFVEDIESLPSAEPKMGRDCTDFVRWLMDEVLDEENWQMNAVVNGEIICRKLKKLGLLDVVDGYYVETTKTGEWTYLHGSIGSYLTISCPFCGTTFNDVAEWEYNYCPNCGARMKGEEE